MIKYVIIPALVHKSVLFLNLYNLDVPEKLEKKSILVIYGDKNSPQYSSIDCIKFWNEFMKGVGDNTMKNMFNNEIIELDIDSLVFFWEAVKMQGGCSLSAQSEYTVYPCLISTTLLNEDLPGVDNFHDQVVRLKGKYREYSLLKDINRVYNFNGKMIVLDDASLQVLYSKKKESDFNFDVISEIKEAYQRLLIECTNAKSQFERFNGTELENLSEVASQAVDAVQGEAETLIEPQRIGDDTLKKINEDIKYIKQAHEDVISEAIVKGISLAGGSRVTTFIPIRYSRVTLVAKCQ